MPNFGSDLLHAAEAATPTFSAPHLPPASPAAPGGLLPLSSSAAAAALAAVGRGLPRSRPSRRAGGGASRSCASIGESGCPSSQRPNQSPRIAGPSYIACSLPGAGPPAETLHAVPASSLLSANHFYPAWQQEPIETRVCLSITAVSPPLPLPAHLGAGRGAGRGAGCALERQAGPGGRGREAGTERGGGGRGRRRRSCGWGRRSFQYLGERLRARRAGRSRHRRPLTCSAPLLTRPSPPRVPPAPSGARSRRSGPGGRARQRHRLGDRDGRGVRQRRTGRVVSPGRPDWLRGRWLPWLLTERRPGRRGKRGGLAARISHPAVDPEGRDRDGSTECGSGCRHLLGRAGNQKQESYQRLGAGNLLLGNLGGKDTPASKGF